MSGSLADATRSDALGIYVAIQLFLFGMTKLHVFRRLDLASMYLFRLAYYGYWHVLWGGWRIEMVSGGAAAIVILAVFLLQARLVQREASYTAADRTIVAVHRPPTEAELMEASRSLIGRSAGQADS